MFKILRLRVLAFGVPGFVKDFWGRAAGLGFRGLGV